MSTLWNRVLWATMAIVCVGFAVTAAEFYLVTVTHSVPSYARLLAWSVSEDFAYGPESGFAQMTPYWRMMPAFNQMVLGTHAVLAALALAVGPFQFVPAFRARWPRAHKLGGRLYVFTALPAMLLAFVYLAITPMDRIYGGAPFYVGLMGIAVMATYTLLAAWVHIMRGEVVAHRTTMVLNFAVMLIAPLLRFWWMFLGWLFLDFGLDQATAHTAVLMFLGLQVVVGAIAVVHLQAPTLTGATSAPITAARVWATHQLKRGLPAATIAGLIAGGALIYGVFITLGAPDPLAAVRPADTALRDQAVYASHGFFLWSRALGLSAVFVLTPSLLRAQFLTHHGAPRVEKAWLLALMFSGLGWMGCAQGYGIDGVGGVGAASYWATLTVATASLGALWVYARHRQQARQVREMTLHLVMIAWAPITQGVFQWGFLWAGFSWEDAFLSAAVMAPPLNLSVSYYYTVYGARPRVAVAIRAKTALPLGGPDDVLFLGLEESATRVTPTATTASAQFPGDAVFGGVSVNG